MIMQMKEGEKNGLRSAARFAIQPNMWGFCGEDTSQEILRNFVAERDINCDLVRETLNSHGFPHLNAFLGTISEISGRETFDEAAVLSYWLGGDLTEEIAEGAGNILVEQYTKQISDEFAKELAKRLPEKIYLTHLTQVALIAAADYDEPEKSQLVNQCMVAYGKIVSIDEENRTVVVERDVLRKMEGGGYEVIPGKQTVMIDPDLTPKLETGDEIAVHLGYLAGKLGTEEIETLKFWTRKVAKII